MGILALRYLLVLEWTEEADKPETVVIINCSVRAAQSMYKEFYGELLVLELGEKKILQTHFIISPPII